MTFKNPQYLVETDWLANHIGDPDLRVLDCTVYMPNYFEESAAEKVEIVSGREHWDQGHIPGSAFADIVGELVDPDNDRFMFPIPDADQFSRVMSRLGIGDDSRVVLYDDMVNVFATRMWWMLRAFGFENAAVLNGGWAKWNAEGRPVSTDPTVHAASQFVARARPDRIATKDEVSASIGADTSCLINALDPDEYEGKGPNRYGRQGHIPGSANMSFLSLLDMDSNTFLAPGELRKVSESAGALNAERVIAYCGGAIAATSAAFVLTLLGAENVAVYDGSMTEWAADPSLPLVTGPAPA
ncbi:MAG: sulfurtransferase [Chloroflexi bacterium]|nr:sulfurtransferase [Chloroflexota bacterium]